MHNLQDETLLEQHRTKERPPDSRGDDMQPVTPREIDMIKHYRAADEVTRARVRQLLTGTSSSG